MAKVLQERQLLRGVKHLMGMIKETKRKLHGSGRLVPTRPTGVEYRVKYGIHLVPDVKQHGRAAPPLQWTKCSVRSLHAHRIPEGRYFLHADEGGVFQVKFTGNSWEYLAAAA